MLFLLRALVPSRDLGNRAIPLDFICALVRLRNYKTRATISFSLRALVPSPDLNNRSIISAFIYALDRLRNQ